MHLITREASNGEKSRNSIGGFPVVPDGYDWPICPETNKKMVLFIQLDLPINLGLGEHAHLSIFMSPEKNEIPSFDSLENKERLADNFWESREKHFKAYFFNGPGSTFDEPDQYLKHQRIEVSDLEFGEAIRIGGEPRWLQDPEIPVGPNGEEFKFVIQIPESYGFQQSVCAPEQPDSFSSTEYCLFFGNEIYVFVSKEIESAEAVWIVVQG